jgi:hypothetical protein
MIGTRTGIKLLRHLGIALIFAPEPFTTPLGVACILVARHLSRRRETTINDRLRQTIQYYLAHTSGSGDYFGGEPGTPRTAKLLSPGKEPAILGQITGSRSFEVNLDSSTWQNWRDMRDDTVHHSIDTQSLSGRYKAGDSFKAESGWAGTSSRTERLIHHTINWEWLSRCYESKGSAVAHSSWACASGAVEGVAHHSINMKLLSQRYKTGGVGQVKVKHHITNMASLQQRYGSAVSYRRVRNALQNNNYYYDIVYRGNVIGGY